MIRRKPKRDLTMLDSVYVPASRLAEFAAELAFDDIPKPALDRGTRCRLSPSRPPPNQPYQRNLR
jgi:hypothetical protein